MSRDFTPVPSNFALVARMHQAFGFPAPLHPQPIPLRTDFPPEAGRYGLEAVLDTMIKLKADISMLRHPDHDQLLGRVAMMLEELHEFLVAAVQHKLDDQADSLIDLTVFAMGTGVMMGLPWDDLFEEVMRANMAKEVVTDATESKRGNKIDLRKPAGWRPPAIHALLIAAGYRGLGHGHTFDDGGPPDAAPSA